MNVRNPALFARLRKVFGEVKVHNQGEPCTYSSLAGVVQLTSWGECYSVCCKFCGDTKFHLWFCHVWGQSLVGANKRVFPAICYRRNCLRFSKNRKQLYEMLDSPIKSSLVLPTKQYRRDEQLPVVDLPAGAVPIIYLPENHEARKYLRDVRNIVAKGYTEQQLWDDFGLHATLEISGDPRLVFPITLYGKMRSWVGRSYTGDSDTKYYYCPSTKVSNLLFNYDNIDMTKPLFIVEGVFDAITVYYKVSHNVVALLGKVLHAGQCALLSRHENIKYLCLDSDAIMDARRQAPKLRNCYVLELPYGDPDSNSEAIIEEVRKRQNCIPAGITC